MREGTDVTLVSFGKLVGYDLEVAEKLEKEGISVEVRARCSARALCSRTRSRRNKGIETQH